MKKLELIVPVLLGIEAVTAKEIRDLGYETTVEDGRVTFKGDFEAIVRVNTWLRTGERVLIKVGEFKAVTFDELFEKCKALNWSEWLTKDCAFPVKGFTLKSTLFSVSDCQSIIKKSIVDSLKNKYNISWFEETGPTYQIQFSIMKDIVTLMIDTTGDGLHKRGYRSHSNAAPLKETIAATLILLSYWNESRLLADPFCGSGTIPIEAALIGKNIAPGLKRRFSAEKFPQIKKACWQETRRLANLAIKQDANFKILASDIDQFAVDLTSKNSYLAGVDDVISVEKCAIKDFKSSEGYGIIICNPPYGERLGEKKEAEEIYRQMGKAYEALDKWSLYALTSDEQFETYFGKPASKKRKLYNGMIKCNYYQYFGPKKPFHLKDK